MVVQWLGLCAFTAEGLDSIPGRATKIPQTSWCGQKKFKNKINKIKSRRNLSPYLSPPRVAVRIASQRQGRGEHRANRFRALFPREAELSPEPKSPDIPSWACFRAAHSTEEGERVGFRARTEVPEFSLYLFIHAFIFFFFFFGVLCVGRSVK